MENGLSVINYHASDSLVPGYEDALYTHAFSYPSDCIQSWKMNAFSLENTDLSITERIVLAVYKNIH